jgi:TP901 family phage tail tape measure protein
MAISKERIEYLIQFVHNRQQAREIIRTLDRMSVSSRGLMQNMGRLASRAALTIPIWLALRSAFMGVLRIFQDGARYIVDFDKALRRAQVVTRGVSDIPAFMSQLREEVAALARQTGEPVERITEAYYRFATAGLDAAEAQEGMRIALKTSIALMGEVESTARAMADIYNVMGDNIENAVSIQEKMETIGSAIALAFQNNAFELNEFTQSLKTFAATAGNLNITYKELVALLAASHTLMQRGATAGTQLTRAFAMMLDRTEKVERILGRPVNWEQENAFQVFLEILTKVDQRFPSVNEKAAALIDLFGLRGQRVALSFAKNIALVRQEVERMNSTSLEELMANLESMNKLQLEGLDRQIKSFQQMRKEMGEAFIKGLAGANDLHEAMERINTLAENRLIPTFEFLGGILRTIGNIAYRFSGGAYAEHFERFLTKRGAFVGGPLVKLGPGATEAKERAAAINLGKIAIEKEFPEENVRLQREINLSFEQRLQLMSRLEALGFSTLEIEKLRLQALVDANRKMELQEKQLLKILQLMNKEVIEFSKNLKEAFTSGLTEFLMKEATLGEIFQRVGDTWRRTFAESISSGLIDQLFKTSGIGELFGTQMSSLRHMFEGPIGKIKNAYDYGANVTYNAIVRGFNNATSGGGSIYAGGGGFTGGGYGGFGGYTLPGFGAGGWLTRPFGGYASTYPGGQAHMSGLGWAASGRGGGPADPRGFNLGGVTNAQILGVGASAAMTGYAGAQAGGLGAGISQGLGALALGAAGMGFGAGAGGIFAAGGAMAGLGALLPIVGIGLMIGGMLFAQNQDPPEYTRTETVTSVRQVASKIDISNRHLEWVNRNLVALRQELTYILPRSYYFRERDEAEAFAIGVARGAS